MSPLLSSSYTIYTHSSHNSSHSSEKEHKPTTSTDQTRSKRKPITKRQAHPTKKTALSRCQIDALESLTTNLQEFINIYNGTPIKLRDKKFHAICRSHLHKISKTKTTYEEKKAMFLSLPKPLTTSITLFKLIFEKESILLLDIISGKTDPKQLQISINQLLQFFSPAYLKRQIYKYVKHKQPFLNEDKRMVTACKKKLKRIEKTYITSEIQSANAKLEYESNSSDEEQKPTKHKQKLDPEANKILESMDNGTIDIKDITSSRKRLILLKVDRDVIKRSINRFRHHIQMSHREDINEVLQIINESGKQTAKIRSIYTHASDQLQSLLDKAYSGVLPLDNVSHLRDLLSQEYTKDQVYACLQKIKKSLIKHNKDNEQLIKKAFKKAHIPPPIKQTHFQDHKTKYDSPVKNHLLTSNKNKSDLDPQAKLILKSLNDCSIKVEDIVKAREQLILLKVKKGTIRQAFHNFKQKIILSSRTDIQKIIQEIDRSGKKARSVKIATQQTSSRLNELVQSASKGTILLQDIKELRRLLFNEFKGARASARLYNAKKALLKKRPQEEHAIRQAFDKINPRKNKESKQSKDLKTAIKSGNLEAQEFTRMYNAITSSEERSSIHKIAALYIHHLSQQTPQLKNKIATVRLLPKHLQTSISTIKSFFPQQHAKISLIRSGQMESGELKGTCLKLLEVVSTTHIRTLLSKYVSNKQTMTTEEKQHVSECRRALLNMQKIKKDTYYSDIDEMKNEDESSTSTSALTVTDNQAERSIEQLALTTESDKIPVLPEAETYTYTNYIVPSFPYHANSWYTSAQPVPSEIPVNILDKPTDSLKLHTLQTATGTYTIEQLVTNTQKSTSPRPYNIPCSIEYITESSEQLIYTEPQQLSTLYPLEIDMDIVQPFYIEQMSSDKLTDSLQGIVNEDACREDQILLQHTLVQLAQDLQQSSDTVEQITTSTSQSSTNTTIIDHQNTHTYQSILDYEPSQGHEDFVYVTDIVDSLSHADFSQLSDTILLQKITPDD